jgi:hypothetical protein
MLFENSTSTMVILEKYDPVSGASRVSDVHFVSCSSSHSSIALIAPLERAIEVSAAP